MESENENLRSRNQELEDVIAGLGRDQKSQSTAFRNKSLLERDLLERELDAAYKNVQKLKEELGHCREQISVLQNKLTLESERDELVKSLQEKAVHFEKILVEKQSKPDMVSCAVNTDLIGAVNCALTSAIQTAVKADFDTIKTLYGGVRPSDSYQLDSKTVERLIPQSVTTSTDDFLNELIEQGNRLMERQSGLFETPSRTSEQRSRLSEPNRKSPIKSPRRSLDKKVKSSTLTLGKTGSKSPDSKSPQAKRNLKFAHLESKIRSLTEEKEKAVKMKEKQMKDKQEEMESLRRRLELQKEKEIELLRTQFETECLEKELNLKQTMKEEFERKVREREDKASSCNEKSECSNCPQLVETLTHFETVVNNLKNEIAHLKEQRSDDRCMVAKLLDEWRERFVIIQEQKEELGLQFHKAKNKVEELLQEIKHRERAEVERFDLIKKASNEAIKMKSQQVRQQLIEANYEHYNKVKEAYNRSKQIKADTDLTVSSSIYIYSSRVHLLIFPDQKHRERI